VQRQHGVDLGFGALVDRAERSDRAGAMDQDVDPLVVSLDPVANPLKPGCDARARAQVRGHDIESGRPGGSGRPAAHVT
jgi:hypothetical protein